MKDRNIFAVEPEALTQIPIPLSGEVDWDRVRRVPISENGEALVPASLWPEGILVRPQYFEQGLRGAMCECYVRRGVFERLRWAASALPPGYRLVILDGFRPIALQTLLFGILVEEYREKHPDRSKESLDRMASRYLALPSGDSKTPPPHSTGGAVDLTIASAEGVFMDMGGLFDETTERSRTDYYERRLSAGETLSDRDMERAKNRRLLHHLMVRAGFTNYSEEWWHYDFGNQLWAYHAARDSNGRAIYGRTFPPFRWRAKEKLRSASV